MKKLLLIALLIVGCAPVFSDLQDAKLIGKGNYELTPSYSKIFVMETGEIQTQFGSQFAYGLNNKIDLRSRIELIKLVDFANDNDVSFSELSLGMKYSVISNQMSFYLPISLLKANNSDRDVIKLTKPTLLFTFPMSNNIDSNSSIKIILPIFGEESGGPFKHLFVLNSGIGINNFEKWIIRLEIGILTRNLSMFSSCYQASVGLSYRF